MTDAQSNVRSGPESSVAPAQPKKVCEMCGVEKPVDTVFACSNCNMNFCLKHLIPPAHHCQGAFGKPMTSRWYSEGN